VKEGTDFVFRCRCSLTRFAQNARWGYRLAFLVFLAGKPGCLKCLKSQGPLLLEQNSAAQDHIPLSTKNWSKKAQN
jgi:hypothetical protein